MSNTKHLKAAYELEVGGFKCRLKEPDRMILKIVYGKLTKMNGEMDTIGAGEIMLNSCWIDGDIEIKQNDGLFISACLKCVELIEQKEATLKKL